MSLGKILKYGGILAGSYFVYQQNWIGLLVVIPLVTGEWLLKGNALVGLLTAAVVFQGMILYVIMQRSNIQLSDILSNPAISPLAHIPPVVNNHERMSDIRKPLEVKKPETKKPDPFVNKVEKETFHQPFVDNDAPPDSSALVYEDVFPVEIVSQQHQIPDESRDLIQSIIGPIIETNFPDLHHRSSEDIRNAVPRIFQELPASFNATHKNPCWTRTTGKRGAKNKLACLPYAYVLGQPKCGTSDLYERLKSHGKIIMPQRKEVRWFTRGEFATRALPYEDEAEEDGSGFEGGMGPNNERLIGRETSVYSFTNYFEDAAKKIGSKKGEGVITIDGGPHTFWWPTQSPDGEYLPDDIPPVQLLHEMQPDAKFILTLADPVRRMYSDYYFIDDNLRPVFSGSHSKSAKQFHERVTDQIELWHSCVETYKSKLWEGHYGEILAEYGKLRERLGDSAVFSNDTAVWFRASQMCAHDRYNFGAGGWGRINIGLYALFFEKWLEYFKPEQFLVLRLDDYNTDSKGYMQRIFQFLEAGEPKIWRTVLSDVVFNENSVDKEPIWPETEKMLREFYQPYNDLMAKFAGNDGLRWDKVLDKNGKETSLAESQRASKKDKKKKKSGPGGPGGMPGGPGGPGGMQGGPGGMRGGMPGGSRDPRMRGGGDPRMMGMDPRMGGMGGPPGGMDPRMMGGPGGMGGMPPGGMDPRMMGMDPRMGGPPGGMGGPGMAGPAGGPPGMNMQPPKDYRRGKKGAKKKTTKAKPNKLRFRPESFSIADLPPTGGFEDIQTFFESDDPDFSNYRAASSQLCVSAFGLDVPALKYMLHEVGVPANVSAREFAERTPLMCLAMLYAMSDPHPKGQVFAMLKGRETWLNQYFDPPVPALQSSVLTREITDNLEHKMLEVAEWLKRGGAAVDEEDITGNQALHHAVNGGELFLVKFLLDMGADPNAYNFELRTPVHYAAVGGHAEILAALVGAGGDLELADRYGTKAIDIIRNPGPMHADDVLKYFGITQRPPRKIDRRVNPELHPDDPMAGWKHGTGGWKTERLAGYETDMSCDVDQYWADEITGEQIFRKYLLRGAPVLIRGLVNDWEAAEKYKFEKLVEEFGDISVKVSDIPYADKFGGGETIEMSLGEYVNDMKEGRVVGGEHPWYVFVAHPIPYQSEGEESLVPIEICPTPQTIIDAFQNMPNNEEGLEGLEARKMFVNAQWALGNEGTGAPIHFHNTAWNACIYGAKKWIIYPPHDMIMSNKQILDYVETDMLDYLERGVRPFTCVQTAGDVMIVPESWGHGVLNLQEGVAVASESMQAAWRLQPQHSPIQQFSGGEFA